MDKNIFVVGSEVKKESQIGYDRYLNNFTNILLNTRNNISITGLKRFGKTSLAKEVLARVKQRSIEQSNGHLIILYIDLAMQKSYSEFLMTIVNSLEEEALEKDDIFDDRRYQHYMNKLEKLNPDSKSYRDSVESLFRLLSAKLGYRIIMAIDEFDAAVDLFKDTADYEFLRDLSSNRDIGMTLLLISRRQLYMIEKKNFNNSTFHGIVQTYPIDGFNEDDFKAFYHVLEDRYGISVSHKDRKLLMSYCGRSPYLNSMFAYDIVEDFEKNRSFDIDIIFRRRKIDIDNYFNSIFACLKNDMIAVPGAKKEMSSIDKLTAIIYGPRLNVDEGDIETLTRMGYLYSDSDHYYSISEYFTMALCQEQLRAGTLDLVLTLEKKLKAMVRKQFQLQYLPSYPGTSADAWDNLFRSCKIPNGSISRLNSFINSNLRKFNVISDMLDVCGLSEVNHILETYWERWFTQYFRSDSYAEWKPKLDACAKARNPMAHGHEEYLTEEEKIRVKGYCTEIIKLLSESDACVIP